MRLFLLWWLLFVALKQSLSFQNVVEVPRMSIEGFHEAYKKKARQTPVVVENALSEISCEEICDMIASSDELQIDLQRKRIGMPTEIYEVNIRQAIEAIMYSSSHNDALFCFEEGLLDELSILTDCRESVFPDEDLFPYFPDYAKSTDCLVLAGEGATSTLHRDPFEWTGTSLCLEGSKVWRFIEPRDDSPDQIDIILDSYRLPSTAWGGDEGIPLSAGWQSDMSLYKRRSETVPSARELQSISHKFDLMRDAAMSTVQLSPTTDLAEEKTNDINIWTTVQKTGDLLVIPAYWWHQTYGLEPSVAVASQRCSPRDIDHVLAHILTTTEMQNIFDLNTDIDYSDLASTIHNFFYSIGNKMETT